jgi:hypothetical protein
MPVLIDNIPLALRHLIRWVCWRWVWNPDANGGRGKYDKPLFDPRTGKHASSTDPRTWTDLRTAYAAHLCGEYDGIGVTLGRIDDGRTLAGLDLDGVRDPKAGTIEPWAELILGRLDSYAEVSPSGKGVKALCWGQLPTGRRADHERGVEMYDSARYWTLTGRRVRPSDVMDRSDVLRQLHAEFLGESSLKVTAGGGRLDDRELALSCLAALNTRRAVAYSDWLAVGMALHSVDPSASMLAEWDRWSRSAPEKYTEGACSKKWATFGRSGITLRSLVFWATSDGWIPPGGRPARADVPLPPAEPSPVHTTLRVLSALKQDPALARVLNRILRDADSIGDVPCA